MLRYRVLDRSWPGALRIDEGSQGGTHPFRIQNLGITITACTYDKISDVSVFGNLYFITISLK